jgi:hypothetical protein
MTRMRARRAWCAPLALVCAIGCSSHSLVEEHTATATQNACAAPPVLNFSMKLATKLFINNSPFWDCVRSTGIVPIPTFNPAIDTARQAAFMAFCRATSLGENPPTDAPVVPLDARILSQAFLHWQCQAGNALPINGNIAGGGSVGGLEGGGAFVGIANAPAVRDNINLNGTFGLVSSGHPNPLAEPAFQAFRPRARSDIWNKITGTISCGVDARGQPTSSVRFAGQFTRFPSHKVWYRAPINAAAVLLFNIPQGSFSNLWWLPAIPAP